MLKELKTRLGTPVGSLLVTTTVHVMFWAYRAPPAVMLRVV